jgi:hypothetical protein
LSHLCEDPVEIFGAAHRHQVKRDPKLFPGSRDGLHDARMRGRHGIPQYTDPPCVRDGFREHLQLLCGEFGEQHRQPSDVSTRMSEARDVSNADGIGMVGEYDGDRLGRLSGKLNGGRRRREDHVDVRTDQIGREVAQLVFAFRPAELDDDVLALDVAKVTQAGL